MAGGIADDVVIHLAAVGVNYHPVILGAVFACIVAVKEHLRFPDAAGDKAFHSHAAGMAANADGVGDLGVGVVGDPGFEVSINAVSIVHPACAQIVCKAYKSVVLVLTESNAVFRNKAVENGYHLGIQIVRHLLFRFRLGYTVGKVVLAAHKAVADAVCAGHQLVLVNIGLKALKGLDEADYIAAVSVDAAGGKGHGAQRQGQGQRQNY